jgi:hypothetical protein
MHSDMPLDMTSQNHQEESESSLSQPKPVPRPATISLSDEQKAILELVVQKKSVFYTGSAGMSDLPCSYLPFSNAIIAVLCVLR